MMKDRTQIFNTMPISKAIITLATPTIITQLIAVLFNMADVFFIGQTGDSAQVAAAAAITPIFMFVGSFASLFGIGGSSLIARSLGEGNRERVKKVSSFALWTALFFVLLYIISLIFFHDQLITLVGGGGELLPYAYQYVFWSVMLGGLPMAFNQVIANLLKAEGFAAHASIGITSGCIINIFLDPVFVIWLKLEIRGAAMATFISNMISLIYFVILLRLKKDERVFSISFKDFVIDMKIVKEVVLVGLPSFFMSFLAVFSNITLNNIMHSYSKEVLAGLGIAKRMDSFMYAISTGISQGTLPLIAYNYAAKNWNRFKESVLRTFAFSFVINTIGVFVLFFFANHAVRFFIDDPLTIQYGTVIQRILCVAGSGTAVTMTAISMFQAIGKKVQPMVLTFLRKGGLDIPFMIIFNHFIGLYGAPIAIPTADVCAMLVSLVLILRLFRSLKKEFGISD